MPIVPLEQFTKTPLDYVVIGGGTSGLVVAARLAEDSNVTVGVIEAGGYHEQDPEINIPGMRGLALGNPKFDWNFESLPQKGLDGRVVPQSRGKGLGGSSAVNFLLSARPGSEELDAIEALGNPGWNWKTFLEYMKRGEHLHEPTNLTPEKALEYAVDPDFASFGHGGPIAKSFPTHVTGLHAKMLDSLEKLGVPRNPGHAGGQPVGAFLIPSTVDPRTATRSYSASAFYAPNSSRSNLLVLTEAHVAKIVLEKDSNGLQKATGVSFIKDGKTLTVAAKREVILSAGSFQTPQILELSGIGNKSRLEPLGIETKVDAPGVGENLQDHAIITTIVEVDPQYETLDMLTDPEHMAAQQKLYGGQQGILAAVPTSMVAFVSGKSLGSVADVRRWEKLASIQAAPEIFKETPEPVKRGIEKQYGLVSKWIDQNSPVAQLIHWNGHLPVPGLTPKPDGRYISIVSTYAHPFTRGTVHITSADPLKQPAIQQNYFANQADLDILSGALRLLLKLYETEPMKGSVVQKVYPTYSSDLDKATAEKHVKECLGTLWHPVGTAAMSPKADGGVVDSNLLVYGTSNLRVVDCSVIPLIVSANIVTLAYAIGEKAADIIKAARK
ncbi:alcohol oxidase [Heliocybe sulcata]|uniref:Alcohol oxidase n=1 Tax=Heliocybe sulcata TaxID=5364 RepID=A0A5C3MVF0_9AGAM|nr:alcohol oxidase [Heliocybe sulcata]